MSTRPRRWAGSFGTLSVSQGGLPLTYPLSLYPLLSLTSSSPTHYSHPPFTLSFYFDGLPLTVLYRSSPPSHPAARGEAFDATVEHMATTEVSSSVYFIVGGSQPGQGAVITRDEQPVAKVTNITIIQRAL